MCSMWKLWKKKKKTELVMEMLIMTENNHAEKHKVFIKHCQTPVRCGRSLALRGLAMP